MRFDLVSLNSGTWSGARRTRGSEVHALEVGEELAVEAPPNIKPIRHDQSLEVNLNLPLSIYHDCLPYLDCPRISQPLAFADVIVYDTRLSDLAL